MLANILPGIREIRAPLAAGYLWFVTAWVILEGRIETGSGASGSVDALTRLKETVGPGAIAAAVTFLAFLIGALWQPLGEAVAEAAWSVRSGIARWRATRWDLTRTYGPLVLHKIALGGFTYVKPFSSRIPWSSWARLGQVGRRLFDQVDEVVLRKLHARRDIAAAVTFGSQLSRSVEEPHTEGSLFWEVTFGSERDLWWQREGNDLTREVFTDELASELFDVDDMLVFGKDRDRLNVYVVGMGEIRSRMFDELSLSARRMVGEEQESYLEVHRMEGEVELRYALAVPVLVTTSVVTFGLGNLSGCGPRQRSPASWLAEPFSWMRGAGMQGKTASSWSCSRSGKRNPLHSSDFSSVRSR